MSERTPAYQPVRVFSGPSLPPQDARAMLPEAICHPPAALGDVYQAATLRPAAIVLIDGYFENQPAVWHKELLWALHQGIAVYGAASMGALRAVEMAPHGMVGVGSIFAAYRDGELEDDDDVAVVHAPAEFDYAPFSEAMVNVIATLDQAVAHDVLSPAQRDVLRTLAKTQHYRERTWPAVLTQARRQLPGAMIDRLERWLTTGTVNQKRNDAAAALARAQADLLDLAGNDHPAAATRAPFQSNSFWSDVTTARPEPLDAGDAALLQALNNGNGFPAADRSRALLRLLALAVARSEGYRAGAGELVQQFREHRARFALDDRAAHLRWLRDNGISADKLRELLTENAMIERVLADLEPLLAGAVLDELRLTAARPKAED